MMTRMPSRIAVIAIDALNPRLVAEFWCNVLGWHVVDEDDEGVISIAPVDGAWPTIDVLGVAERKAVKNRLHLDLRADGVATPVELERLLSLGAPGRYRPGAGRELGGPRRPRGQRVLPAREVGPGGLTRQASAARCYCPAQEPQLHRDPTGCVATAVPHSLTAQRCTHVARSGIADRARTGPPNARSCGDAEGGGIQWWRTFAPLRLGSGGVSRVREQHFPRAPSHRPRTIRGYL